MRFRSVGLLPGNLSIDRMTLNTTVRYSGSRPVAREPSSGQALGPSYALYAIPPYTSVGSGEVPGSGRHRGQETMPGSSSSRPS